MVWGPQADLARDPRWGRAEEVYGEDPFFNGVMATAFARGIQGNDPKYWQAAPLLKHFLANSNENGRMSSNSQFDERLFWEYYSVPFRMTFQDAGANAVMASYNAWNGTPMHLHPVLRDVLIGQWGVQVISSDGGGVQNLWEDHKVVPDQKAAVVAALKAGINQYLDRALEELRAALKEGLVTEADLDEALRRKFRVSLKLGLLDPPEIVPYARPHDGPAPWDSPEHLAISKTMALESIVLLKNDGGALPLRKGALKSVAVIGPRADSVHWDWYGGTPPHATTPLQGIRDAVGPGVTVSYAPDDEAGAAVKAASGLRRGDRRGRQPPDLRPQHGEGVDEGRRHRALRGPGRRARGPRPRDAHPVPGRARPEGARRESPHGHGAGVELPVHHQLVAGARAGDRAHGALLAGRGLGARAGAVRGLQPRRPHRGHLAGVTGRAAADAGLRHPPRPDLHVRQGHAALSRSATA